MRKSPEEKHTCFLLTWSRKECLTFAGLMTGHILLASISNDKTRRKCREIGMRKTLEYLLCFCSALYTTRFKYLGASQLKGMN